MFMPRAAPCGMVVHNEVTFRALEWFVDDHGGNYTFPADPSTDYRAVVREYLPYAQAGSFFPDWGYKLLDQDGNCELAHWAGFIRTAVKYKLTAFLFGVVSHDIADVLWHGLNNEQEGFIRAVSFGSMDSQYDLAHVTTDTGAEFILHHSLDLDYIDTRWKVPVDDVMAIYKDMGVELDWLVFQTCFVRGYAAAIANKSPVIVEHMENYYRGGLKDMSVWVQHCWKELIDWMDGDVELTEGLPFCNLLIDYEGKYKDNFATTATVDNTYKLKSNKTVSLTGGHDVRKILNSIPGANWVEEIAGKVENSDLVFELKRGFNALREKLSPKGRNTQTIFDVIKYGGKCEYLDKAFSQVLTLTTSSQHADLGKATAVGDFDGSGTKSIAIGAPYFKDQTVRGAVFILRSYQAKMGKQSPQDIAHMADQTLLGDAGLKIPNRFGYSLAVLDFNQDGIDDLAVGAPAHGGFEMTYQGKIHVYFGIKGQGLSTTPNVIIQLDSLRHTNTQLGEVLHVGNVQGPSSHQDLLVGAPFYEVRAANMENPQISQAGAVFAFHSRSFASANGQASKSPVTITEPNGMWLSDSPSPYEWFGRSVRFESVNNQRMLLVGAPGYKEGDNSMAGKVYGFNLDEGTNKTHHLAFSVLGSDKFQQLGNTISVGQVLGDGKNYLVASAPSQTVEESRLQLNLHPIDRLAGVPSGWQKGAVHVISLGGLTVNTPLASVQYQFGADDASHFGWHHTLNDRKDRIYVSEPYTEDEQGRIYAWNPAQSSKSLSCYLSNIKLQKQRFGSHFVTTDLNGDGNDDMVVTALHSSLSARGAGIVQIALT
ncbi:hypothetical protein H4R35_002975 [Dimargaris xerosporica]|nr:hypothetical protein H4R35_002975 [Dimargaris xerosporica]